MSNRYGKLSIVGEASPRPYFTNKGKLSFNRYIVVQCECGSEPFEVAVRHLPKRKNKSCGCDKVKRIRDSDHGMSKSPTYGSWVAMKRRCMDVNDVSYSDYGGAGITICERWMSFKNFFEDMGERPEGYTVNRINGARVYSKETCEWATHTLQAYDQKMKSNNTSGRTGVYWRKDRNVWCVRIWKEGKTYGCGSYKNYDEAVAARDKAEKELYAFTKK